MTASSDKKKETRPKKNNILEKKKTHKGDTQ